MRRLLPLLAATALAAAEPAVTPLLEASVPDGARLRQRFAEGIYGKVWGEPALAPLRTQMMEGLTGLKTSKQVDLGAWWEALRNAGVVLLALPAEADGEPRMLMVADLGAQTGSAFDAWRAGERKAADAVVAGADAAFTTRARKGETVVVARAGTVLSATNTVGGLPTWRPAADEADLLVQADLARLLAEAVALAPAHERDEAELAQALLAPALGGMAYRMQLVPEGLLERLELGGSHPWLAPVDRTLLDRLPANTLAGIAIGVHGKPLWEALRGPLLAAIAREEGLTPEDAESMIDAHLAGMGVEGGITRLIEGIDGTVAFAIAPAAPFPSGMLTVPRSAGVDQLVLALLRQVGADAPPEGQSVPLPMPQGMPLTISLARDGGHWLLTSDLIFGDTWVAGEKGGWLDSPAAKLALERGGAAPVILGASDTPALLRTFTPLVSLGMGQLPLEQQSKQATLTLLTRLAGWARTGYIVARPRAEGGTEVEIRGLVGWGGVPLLSAAIAIPNLVESRAAAQQASAASALKSGFFPAQITFQAGMYADENGDGLGDFGFPSEMAGGSNPSNLVLSLLPEAWNAEQPEVNGYAFRVWLPDGKGGAAGSPAERTAAKAAADRFVAYAWPVDGEGDAMFAITEVGTVYTAPFTGEPPLWHSLWGDAPGDGWGPTPAWAPFRR